MWPTWTVLQLEPSCRIYQNTYRDVITVSCCVKQWEREGLLQWATHTFQMRLCIRLRVSCSFVLDTKHSTADGIKIPQIRITIANSHHHAQPTNIFPSASLNIYQIEQLFKAELCIVKKNTRIEASIYILSMRLYRVSLLPPHTSRQLNRTKSLHS